MVILPGIGLIMLELSYVLQALGLFVVLLVGGAAGGITYHISAPIRRTGTLGHNVAAILTVYGYVLGVLGVRVSGAALIGWEAIGPDLVEMLADPVDSVVMGILGVVFGIVLGRSTRQ